MAFRLEFAGAERESLEMSTLALLSCPILEKRLCLRVRLCSDDLWTKGRWTKPNCGYHFSRE